MTIIPHSGLRKLPGGIIASWIGRPIIVGNLLAVSENDFGFGGIIPGGGGGRKLREGGKGEGVKRWEGQ